MGGKNGLRPKLPRLMPVRYREDFAAVMDGRSRLAREGRDRLSALVADLGGEEALSHAHIGPHTQLVGGLVGVYRLLGLKRQAREVARLSDYLKRAPSTTP